MPLALLNGNDGTLAYDAFLKEKVAFDRSFGFDPDATLLATCLKPHQRAIIDWAVKGGRRAIFAAFGLGKSVMQLSILQQVIARHGGSALIVAPLGVRSEFIRDGRDLLGIEVRFIRRTEEIDDEWSGIYITNYESVRDGRLNVSGFTAVSLDEAAVLASYGSKTTQELLDKFADIPFRYVATATPSPNEYLELINYASFLGIMDRGAALTRFFQRDSKQAGNLTLYPHKRDEFWLWLNTWACFVQRPSDLGFPDDGYALPPLELIWHEVEVDITGDHVDRDGQARMYRGGNMSSVEASKEKRDTLPERLAEVMVIVREHHTVSMLDFLNSVQNPQIVIWCDLNDEQSEIEKALTAEGISFSSIYGGLSDDEAEKRLDAWRNQETYALIGKPVMLGQGMNLQQANVGIFAGVTYKFRQTIQAAHRQHRFGQKLPVTLHLILAETEGEVRSTLERKWAEHEALTERMSDLIRKHGLNSLSISAELERAMGVDREVESKPAYTLALNDCVIEVRDFIDANYIDLLVTSIPFGNHYEYSLNYADFGHTDDNDHFWWQMDYATPEFYRALKPGRIMAVHVKDRIRYGKVTGRGLPTSDPFHAEAIAHYMGHGFDYLGMITITTDVVRENNQTYRLGYTKMLKDSSMMGVGSPEYLLIFHKPQTDRSKGWADDRITHDRDYYSLARWQIDADAKWRSSGDRLLTLEEIVALDPATRDRVFKTQGKREVYDFRAHLALAEALEAKNALSSEFASMSPAVDSPFIWDEVDRLATLNGEQSRRNLEYHICPLQFDIVDRVIERWSEPGDLVLDPFAGLGTVPLRARRLGRRGYGVELNPTSHRDAVMYQHEEDRKASLPTLFDLFAIEGIGGAA